MTYLLFNSENDANQSLNAINNLYGCPYADDNGYVMQSWDNVKKFFNEDKWYFAKPEARLGKTLDELMATIVAGHEEADEISNAY